MAHAPAYVAAVLGQRLDAADLRRLGLPLTAAVVARSRAAVGGTLLTARLPPRTASPATPPAAATTPSPASGPGSASSTTSPWPPGCCSPRAPCAG
ncbi:MAG: hypothetical protein R3C69_00090 [Geminicoccaceae bacterium]